VAVADVWFSSTELGATVSAWFHRSNRAQCSLEICAVAFVDALRAASMSLVNAPLVTGRKLPAPPWSPLSLSS
jgi:hypothetical protein